MHTEAFETISDFTPIRTDHELSVNRAQVSGVHHLAVEPVLFDQPVSGDRVSEMLKRLMPKNDLLFAPALDVRLKVRLPFIVHLEAAEDGVTAHAKEIQEFGFGANRGEALDDLARTMSELYFSLDTDRDRLSNDLGRTLQVLEAHLIRVRE